MFRPDLDEWRRRRANFPGAPKLLLDSRDEVLTFYEDFYNEHETLLAPYFRNLYHVIKFVKTSDIQDKRRYTSLARAQLSKHELFLLFYDCLSSQGKGFKPLVEEFGLLEHFDKKLLLNQSHAELYASSAYQ